MPVFPAAALRTALLALVLWAGGPTLAHEGHDHGSEAQGAPSATAPRATSSTDALELVAIARNGRLAVYLDRAGTNEPVTEAVIKAETPEGPADGKPMPDGSYGFDAPWSQHPGEHEVLLTVTVAGESDLFPVTLTVPQPPPLPRPRASPPGPRASRRPTISSATSRRPTRSPSPSAASASCSAASSPC